jgi:hypothetical protein
MKRIHLWGLTTGSLLLWAAVSFFPLDGEGTQQIAEQVRGLLGKSGTQSAGLQAVSAEEWGWERAEAILPDGIMGLDRLNVANPVSPSSKQFQRDGMDEPHQALVKLLPSGSSEDVKPILRSAASGVALGEDPLIALIRAEIVAFLTRFNTPNIAPKDAEMMAQEFVESLQAVIDQLQNTGLFSLLSRRPGWADFLASLGLPIGGNPEDIFKKLMHVLIQHVFYTSGNSPVSTSPSDPCSAACRVVTRDLKAFLQWINLNPDRVDVGFGNLMAAFSVSTLSEQTRFGLMPAFSAARTGWQIKGIWGGEPHVPPQPTEDQAFLIGLLPKDRSPSGRSIVVAVRGDSCQECGTEQNIRDILGWVETVFVKKTVFDPDALSYSFDADRGAMVLAFTRPGETGTDNIIQALEADFANSEVPIIIAWLSADGNTVYYDCVGRGCENLSEEEQEGIACDWVLGSSTCRAQR